MKGVKHTPETNRTQQFRACRKNRLVCTAQNERPGKFRGKPNLAGPLRALCCALLKTALRWSAPRARVKRGGGCCVSRSSTGLSRGGRDQTRQGWVVSPRVCMRPNRAAPIAAGSGDGCRRDGQRRKQHRRGGDTNRYALGDRQAAASASWSKNRNKKRTERGQRAAGS